MDHQDPALARLIDHVKSAAASRTALQIRGGGTKDFYGAPAKGAPLDLRELAGVSSHEPSELVVTVRAGTPLCELEALLADTGQCLPFEPPRFAAGGTVGGMVAAGLAGPARASVGTVRDYVLGVSVLTGRGEVLSFGGQVMKNVAGYDVSRLMAGSLGVLGVLCEVSLKVLPVAPASQTRVFEFGQAAALQRLHALSARPLPVNASAWHAGQLYLRLRGARAAVQAAGQELGGQLLDGDGAWWTAVRDHAHPWFAAARTAATAGESLWRLSVPDVTPPLDLPGEQFVEWGGSLRWLRTRAPAQAIRSAAAAAGGHATLFLGSDRGSGVFTPLPAPLMQVHRRLKMAFDPDGLFNPGRLYPDL